MILNNLKAEMPSSSNWFSTTYGNGKFVTIAVSGTDRVAYSEDGITWTETTLPSSANWYSVTYGNGKFVAVAKNSTTAAYSEDGITWTATNLPSSAYWYSVTYGNGKFVAVAQSSTTAAFSYDGITWYDSVQYISQNDTDVTANALGALKHTHPEYLTEQVQADLNQTDETAPDYVKGTVDHTRLPEGYPYKETAIVTEFLPETEVDFFEIEGMFPNAPELDVQVPDFGLEKEKQYSLRIMWDGVPYDRTVLAVQNYQYAVGNMALAGGGDDTGEPFLIMMGRVTGGDATYEVDFSFMANSAGKHTVSIAEVSETIQPMAEEFMPLLTSPNGTKYKLTVSDDGTLSAVAQS